MNLRFGLVGRGRWGRNIERTLLSFPGVSVTPIARGDTPPTWLDGVLVATPSGTHAEVALPYIEAGVPVFIEKPMTTTVADAERMHAAAGQSGSVVFVGHLYLYHPVFLAALDVLPKLGVVRHVLGTGMNENSRGDCSVLWDWLPHDLSMGFAIFGHPPAKATAWSLEGGAVPRAATAKFQFGDVPLVATVSWLSPVRRRHLTIVGENATLIFDNTATRKLALYEEIGGEPSYPGYSEELPLTCEMRAFLEAVRSGTAGPSNARMGADIVRAIAAAENSIERGEQAVLI